MEIKAQTEMFYNMLIHDSMFREAFVKMIAENGISAQIDV